MQFSDYVCGGKRIQEEIEWFKETWLVDDT